MLQSRYGASHAIVIGINSYTKASPLIFAVSDATAVAAILVGDLGFTHENVVLLTDGAATKEAILDQYMALTQDGTDIDDRVFVFFAGHGHTLTSSRGEVGFLVPHDGDPMRLSTLIRWDELTRYADLIPAKHMLFIMDACYGGLAITRNFRAGTMRFLENMLQRTSRQVLTAGKGDELVSDAGGPLPEHSVFTGHLLEALSGKATDNSGNLTASGLIAYVYQAVSRDPDSSQTPHYGYLSGDGDFIFRPLPADVGVISDEDNEPTLISVPSSLDTGDDHMENLDQLKDLLSDSRNRIRLRDFINSATRKTLALTGDDYFPVQQEPTEESFLKRLAEYEAATSDLLNYVALIGYYGQAEHFDVSRIPFRRLSERLSYSAGSAHLNNMRWYPIFLLMYANGLGATAAGNYAELLTLFETPMPDPRTNESSILISAVTTPMTESYDLFKWTPEGKNKKVSRSEFLFKSLQPRIDDLLFLGREYEEVFDRFEILYGLEYAHRNSANHFGWWGPIGRYGWKIRSGASPLKKLRDEAERYGDMWQPLTSGFFDGSLARFYEVCEGLTEAVTKSYWYL